MTNKTQITYLQKKAALEWMVNYYESNCIKYLAMPLQQSDIQRIIFGLKKIYCYLQICVNNVICSILKWSNLYLNYQTINNKMTQPPDTPNITRRLIKAKTRVHMAAFRAKQSLKGLWTDKFRQFERFKYL